MTHDLQRFVDVQDPVWEQVREELGRGHKTSHWMWFIFPQIAGLGTSPTARLYAIGSLGEARAYLAHPVLGTRLREAVALMLRHRERTATSILGAIDALKLRSSLTLFAAAGGGETFDTALTIFHGGPDPTTLRLLHLASN